MPIPQDKTLFSQMLRWQSGGDKNHPCSHCKWHLCYLLITVFSLCPSPLCPSSLQIFWENSWGPDEGFGCLSALPAKTNISQDESRCPQDVYTQLPSHPWPGFASFIHFLRFIPPDTHRQTQTACIGRSPSHAFSSTASDLLVLPQIWVTSPCRPSAQKPALSVSIADGLA